MRRSGCTSSSSDRPSAAASAATVKKAGVGMRPVSILRSVSAGTPDAAATSTMLRRAARLAQQRAEPLAALAFLGVSGGRTMAVILIPV